jgi:hypothetical protein
MLIMSGHLQRVGRYRPTLAAPRLESGSRRDHPQFRRRNIQIHSRAREPSRCAQRHVCNVRQSDVICVLHAWRGNGLHGMWRPSWMATVPSPPRPQLHRPLL